MFSELSDGLRSLVCKRPRVVVDRDSRFSTVALGGIVELLLGGERIPNEEGRFVTPNPLGHLILVPRYFKFETPVLIFSGESPQGLRGAIFGSRTGAVISTDYSAIGVSHSSATARAGLIAARERFGKLAEAVYLQFAARTLVTEVRTADDGGYKTCRHTVSNILDGSRDLQALPWGG